MALIDFQEFKHKWHYKFNRWHAFKRHMVYACQLHFIYQISRARLLFIVMIITILLNGGVKFIIGSRFLI